MGTKNQFSSCNDSYVFSLGSRAPCGTEMANRSGLLIASPSCATPSASRTIAMTIHLNKLMRLLAFGNSDAQHVLEWVSSCHILINSLIIRGRPTCGSQSVASSLLVQMLCASKAPRVIASMKFFASCFRASLSLTILAASTILLSPSARSLSR